jgi:hypothetical protein
VQYIGYLIGNEEDRLAEDLEGLREKEFLNEEDAENIGIIKHSLTKEIPDLRQKLGLLP